MVRIPITEVTASILRKNRALYTRQGNHARIAEIDAELARRAGERFYVLTETGEFEHIQGERAGFTACGVAIDTTRQYGDREWWHCMSCERAAH